MQKIEDILHKIPLELSRYIYNGDLIVREIERNPKYKRQEEDRKSFLRKFKKFELCFYIIESSVKYNCNYTENYLFLNEFGEVIMNLSSNDINICWITKNNSFEFETKFSNLRDNSEDIFNKWKWD